MSGLLASTGPDEPCERCDDSGWVEFSSGGLWTGEGMTIRQEPCDCICGEDVRREIAERAAEIQRLGS